MSEKSVVRLCRECLRPPGSYHLSKCSMVTAGGMIPDAVPGLVQDGECRDFPRIAGPGDGPFAQACREYGIPIVFEMARKLMPDVRDKSKSAESDPWASVSDDWWIVHSYVACLADEGTIERSTCDVIIRALVRMMDSLRGDHKLDESKL